MPRTGSESQAASVALAAACIPTWRLQTRLVFYAHIIIQLMMRLIIIILPILCIFFSANISVSMTYRVAIIGGGITGATVFNKLTKLLPAVHVDIFDQGRAPGGRASTRFVPEIGNGVSFDHGAQFFRADTSEMRELVADWLKEGWVQEWAGPHSGSGDFFGLPSAGGPVYVSSQGGMCNIPTSLIYDAVQRNADRARLFASVRVENVERGENNKWRLFGKGGKAALHDTSEEEARAVGSRCLHAEEGHEGYDWVVLTDISSVFGSWHRASAGVPEGFSRSVRDKAGARVPLFSAMVAFKAPLDLPTSSITFDAADTDNGGVWFAAKTNSKPGFSLALECWTIISTPAYALKKIEETPMQDPVTGEFIPQSPDYLLKVPGPELLSEFLRLCGREGAEVAYLNAQRWGSAMPAQRSLARDASSTTRKVLSGVAYDVGMSALAPTVRCNSMDDSIVFDDSLNCICAGDMVSAFTPGFEGAVLSALEAVRLLNTKLT